MYESACLCPNCHRQPFCRPQECVVQKSAKLVVLQDGHLVDQHQLINHILVQEHQHWSGKVLEVEKREHNEENPWDQHGLTRRQRIAQG